MTPKINPELSVSTFTFSFMDSHATDHGRVIQSQSIRCDDIGNECSILFLDDTGNETNPSGVTFCALKMKETFGIPDEKTAELIWKKSCLQYVLHSKNDSNKKSFAPSLAKQPNKDNEILCEQVHSNKPSNVWNHTGRDMVANCCIIRVSCSGKPPLFRFISASPPIRQRQSNSITHRRTEHHEQNF